MWTCWQGLESSLFHFSIRQEGQCLIQPVENPGRKIPLFQLLAKVSLNLLIVTVHFPASIRFRSTASPLKHFFGGGSVDSVVSDSSVSDSVDVSLVLS